MTTEAPRDIEAQTACDKFFFDFRTHFVRNFRADYDTDRTRFEQMFAGTWQAVVLESFYLSEKHIAYGTSFHTTILRVYKKEIDEVIRPFLLSIGKRGVNLYKVAKNDAINYTYAYCLRAIQKLVPPEIKANIAHTMRTGGDELYRPDEQALLNLYRGAIKDNYEPFERHGVNPDVTYFLFDMYFTWHRFGNEIPVLTYLSYLPPSDRCVIFAMLLKKDPTNVEIYNQYSMALLKSGQPKAALTLLDAGRDAGIFDDDVHGQLTEKIAFLQVQLAGANRSAHSLQDTLAIMEQKRSETDTSFAEFLQLLRFFCNARIRFTK